jgi:predicted nucleic acid-binding protein
MKSSQVVLDSNIYISGLVFGGIPSDVLVLARLGRFLVYTSEYIQLEVENTLALKFSWPANYIAHGRCCRSGR